MDDKTICWDEAVGYFLRCREVAAEGKTEMMDGGVAGGSVEWGLVGDRWSGRNE